MVWILVRLWKSGWVALNNVKAGSDELCLFLAKPDVPVSPTAT